jgi:hypothetical protein
MSGKYMGYSGFPPGISLGKNLIEPLSQQAGNTNTSSFNPVDYYKSLEGLPESTRNSLLLQEVNNRSSNKIGEDDTLLKIFNKVTDPARQKETLDQQLAYDKARMKEAFPYLMAREIPRQISEGFGNAAMIKVLGARNASEAMNQTLASYPRLNLQATSFQPQKYFS